MPTKKQSYYSQVLSLNPLEFCSQIELLRERTSAYANERSKMLLINVFFTTSVKMSRSFKN